MKRKVILTVFSLAITAAAMAESWIDITASCIPDPNYKHNNYDGWTLESWFVGSTATRTNCQEFWNGIWDFYRDVQVPAAGKYRLSVQAYYRPGDFNNGDWQAHENGTEDIPCVLYANDDIVSVQSIYSAYRDYSWGDCWNVSYNNSEGERVRRYFPNSMEAGYQQFLQDLYWNKVETNVDDSRQMRIGIRVDWDGYENSNWVLFTGWKVEWYGTEVPATAIELGSTSLDMAEGEEHQMTWSVLPENTSFKDVTFTSSDNSVVSVDETGMLKAHKSGTATITVRMATGSSTATATCAVTVRNNEVAPGSLVINEIQVANIDQYLDPSFNFGGWVELYNPTATSVSLTGVIVSDNKGNSLTLDSHFGAIPAHGFKIVWFDHYTAWSPQMVTFKLDADGGTITFAKKDGTVLAQQQYPAAVTRTSYARTTDGGQAWGITDRPTPAATNANSPFATTRLEPPTFNHAGGIITDNSLTVRITKPTGATLRYTTDGTTPTLDNGMTSKDGRFDISESTVFRARVYKEGMLASAVVTRTFIFPDQNYLLPILAITTDEDGLFGDDYGIFVQGNGNGRPGNGQDARCNWNMEWDRPVNMEFFVDGQSVFNQELTIEAAGGWSRAWAPHSFNIKSNKIYEGKNRMEYQFFPEEPFLSHKALKIRNGGNDTQCRIKDAAIQEVVRTSGLYAETQGYRPVHVFFNGQFYNTLNLREPNNRNYAYAHYGIDTDEQDQWKMSPDSGYVQQVGTREVWDELVRQSESAGSPSSYQVIQRTLDIENYCNYMAVMMYIGGNDWPQNNIKAFKAWEDGKWRFVIFDTDGAFATTSPFTTFANKRNYTFDSLRGAEERYPYGTRLKAEIQFVTLFLNLLQNEDFKKQFIDQFCIVAGSVFEPTRSREVIDALVEEVKPAREQNLWGPWGGDWYTPDNTANNVKSNLSSGRQNSLITALRNYLNLNTPVTVKLTSNAPGAGLRINGLPVPTGAFNGKLFAPATITATPPAGYRFVGWSSGQTSSGTVRFAKGSEWKYYDQGSLDGQDWKARSFTDASWSSGRAPLGYDTGNAQKAAAYGTTLSYGNNSSDKYPTCYFRKHVNLTDTPDADDTFTLDWVADDGFVIYVNGTEAGRFLMSNTPSPTFNSLADTYANANPESGQMVLPTNLFTKGDNVIAIELHNNSTSSTDIYWDAALTHASTKQSGTSIDSTDPAYDLPASGSITLTAIFEELDAQELANSDARPIKINEVSAANDIFVSDLFKKSDWLELYNTTPQDIDVAGMFLSDDITEPKKFRIPASNGTYSTIVPAHGHLVVWADKLEGMSQIHANFKLASEQGDVTITAADASWADTLSYCAHTGLQTVGLYPDGGTEVYVMEHPTIGATNVITLIDKVWNEPNKTSTSIQQPTEESDGKATDVIYDISGRQRATRATIDRLPQGIYILNGKKIIR